MLLFDFLVKIACLFVKKMRALHKTPTRGKNKDSKTREWDIFSIQPRGRNIILPKGVLTCKRTGKNPNFSEN